MPGRRRKRAHSCLHLIILLFVYFIRNFFYYEYYVRVQYKNYLKIKINFYIECTHIYSECILRTYLYTIFNALFVMNTNSTLTQNPSTPQQNKLSTSDNKHDTPPLRAAHISSSPPLAPGEPGRGPVGRIGLEVRRRGLGRAPRGVVSSVEERQTKKKGKRCDTSK